MKIINLGKEVKQRTSNHETYHDSEPYELVNPHYAIAGDELFYNDFVYIEEGICYHPRANEARKLPLYSVFDLSVAIGEKATLVGEDSIIILKCLY